MRTRLQRLLSLWMVCGLCSVSLAAADSDFRLIEAVKQQDKAAVRQLLKQLKQKVDVNAVQPDGTTALHWAAHWGDVETTDLLIARGAKVNAANDYGATALWVACANRNPAIVQKLLDASANANIGLLSGETVLMRCAFTGDPAAVEALLARGADLNAQEPSTGQTALMWAVANRHADVTRVLLAHGASVGARTADYRDFRSDGPAKNYMEFNAGRFTPLLFAARHDDVDSARLLLDAGANVNDTAGDGNSALVVAAMSGHGQFASFLLDRGADPNAAGAGYTALHAAVLRSDPALVRALLAKGANPNARLTKSSPVPRQTYQFVFVSQEFGATPYVLAAMFIEPELLRILAAAGADPLLPLDNGTTALMAAVGVGLNRTLDRRSRMIAPELIAAEFENEARVLETVKLAIDVGATMSVDQANNAGETALHGAARNGYKQVLEFLVAHGGDLTIKDKAGKTAQELLIAPATNASR